MGKLVAMQLRVIIQQSVVSSDYSHYHDYYKSLSVTRMYLDAVLLMEIYSETRFDGFWMIELIFKYASLNHEFFRIIDTFLNASEID